MKITKRQAILAIAGIPAAIATAQEKEKVSWLTMAREGPLATLEPMPTNPGMTWTLDFFNDPNAGIIIRYKGRTARIAANELMDALEGK